jgi:hypothetical protein
MYFYCRDINRNTSACIPVQDEFRQNSDPIQGLPCTIQLHKLLTGGIVMRKLIITLLVAAPLLFAASVAQAHSYGHGGYHGPSYKAKRHYYSHDYRRGQRKHNRRHYKHGKKHYRNSHSYDGYYDYAYENDRGRGGRDRGHDRGRGDRDRNHRGGH